VSDLSSVYEEAAHLRENERRTEVARLAAECRLFEAEMLGWEDDDGTDMTVIGREPAQVDHSSGRGNLRQAGRPPIRLDTIVDLAGLLLPVGLADEQLGDALERAHDRLADGHPPWQAYLLVISNILWAFVHAPIYKWHENKARREAGK